MDVLSFDAARARVVRRAVAVISPATVTIETVGGAQPLREGTRSPVEESFRMADGPATGIILSPDGLILTSSFNFARAPTVITVLLSDGRRFVAHLLARDHIRRLALLRIDAEDLPVAEWAGAADLRVGQYAIACGRGLGGARPFVSVGIISAVGRRNGLAIQTDARTSPISYGGPLIDVDGRVLGVIVPMAGAGGGALAGAHWYDSGIGFAVGRAQVDTVLKRLRAGEDIEPGKIGVVLAPVEEEGLDDWLWDIFPRARGVRIVTIADPSPAKRAALEVGDVILALDGAGVSDIADLQRKLSDRAAGESVTLSVKRRWRSFEVKVELARVADLGAFEAPQPAAPPDVEGEAPRESPPTTQPEGD